MRSVKMSARHSLVPADDGQTVLLKEKVARLEKEQEQTKTAACAASVSVANKRVSLDSMSSEELRSSCETLSIRNDLVQEELQRVQAMCDRLQDEIVRVRSEAAADRDTCNTLQSSLKNERAASDALERSLHALQAELISVYSKLHDQESNGSSLQMLEQDMKKLQLQDVASSDQLRAKEVALQASRTATVSCSATRSSCSTHSVPLITRARCEKLQAASDEAVSASEKHQVALTKQADANKVLDNDLIISEDVQDDVRAPPKFARVTE
jgi:chromosome segregation ATPase